MPGELGAPWFLLLTSALHGRDDVKVTLETGGWRPPYMCISFQGEGRILAITARELVVEDLPRGVEIVAKPLGASHAPIRDVLVAAPRATEVVLALLDELRGDPA